MSRWEKFWLIGALAFITTALMVFSAVAMWSKADAVTGYLGSIIGGLIGGAMTIAAGWMAWSAAQQQIAKQDETINLLVDEQRRRLVTVMIEVAHGLERITSTASMTIEAIDRGASDFLLATEFLKVEGLKNELINQDLWRIDIRLAQHVRELMELRDGFNAYPIVQGSEQKQKLMGIMRNQALLIVAQADEAIRLTHLELKKLGLEIKQKNTE